METVYNEHVAAETNAGFRRVPAVDKCFSILELLARSKDPLGVSEISVKLGLNKSTVFQIGRTLVDLHVLENQGNGKFVFGTRFYVLSNMARKHSPLVKIIHEYLEKINQKTNLSAFLGVRSDCRAILIDKVDSAYRIKVSSEIGTQMPVLGGAGIKAMLAQVSDEGIDHILSRTELSQFTRHSITDKAAYKAEILKVRNEGVAYDREEYIEGMVAFAVPVEAYGRDVQAAIWAVALAHQASSPFISEITHLLKGIREEINVRLR